MMPMMRVGREIGEILAKKQKPQPFQVAAQGFLDAGFAVTEACKTARPLVGTATSS